MQAASTVFRRPAWRACMATLGLLLGVAAHAQAPIEIKPLPEARHATVTQLGATKLDAKDLQPWLDAQMQAVMQKGGVTGAVAVVVKDGEILHAKGYGYADAGAKKPVDAQDTLFRVGSLSAQFTWTAAMQLVEKHKLELDADINRYLDFIVPPRNGKPVTLRDLMTQTAGFEDAVKDRYAYDAASLIPYDAWVKRWTPARIYTAGEVPAYSSYGVALAGYLVQRASGQPFADYMDRHILQPLDMKHASFRQPLPASLQDDVALSYGPFAPPRPFDLRTAVPAAALSVSGEDMAHFMVAHLQYGRSGNAQLLEQASVQAMQSEQRTAIPGLPGMALGWERMDLDGQTALGQASDYAGSHHLLVLLPEQHAGLFIATDGGDASLLLRPLAERFAHRYFPPLPRLKPPTLATDKQHAAQIAGRYVSSIRSQSNVAALRDLFSNDVSVRLAADGSLQVPMLRDAHWREISPYLWLDDATGRRLGALVRNGKVQMFSIDTLSPTQVFMPATGSTPAQVATFLIVLLAVFAGVALSWPLAAFLRRGRDPSMSDEDARWYRLSRLTAVFYLLLAGGWWLLMPRLGMPGLDTRMRLLHMLGLLAALGTAAVAMETWRAWRNGSWWRRIGDSALLLACLAAVAFMAYWHVLSPRLAY